METINGTKNPIIRTLKDGDVVMLEIPTDGKTFKQIVKLKNLRYMPADIEFDFDWLEFDGDVLYLNFKMHKSNIKPFGNCLSISSIIPNELIEITARNNDMWRSDLYQLTDAEFELQKRKVDKLFG